MKRLIWTIRDEGIQFPSDENLYRFANTLPESGRDLYPMENTGFALERFGNSVRVYTILACLSRIEYKSVGLFTWGMTRQEAQQK